MLGIKDLYSWQESYKSRANHSVKGYQIFAWELDLQVKALLRLVE